MSSVNGSSLPQAVARAFASRRLVFDRAAVVAAEDRARDAAADGRDADAAFAVLLLSDAGSPFVELAERAALQHAFQQGEPDDALRVAALVLYRLTWIRGTVAEWQSLDGAVRRRGELDGTSLQSRLTWHAARAQAAAWCDEVPAARSALAAGLALARAHGVDSHQTPLTSAELLVALAAGDTDAAGAILRAAPGDARALSAYDSAHRALLVTWQHLLANDAQAADAEAARGLAHAHRSGAPVAIAWATLASAAALAATGRRREALRSLSAAGRLARRLRATHLRWVEAHIAASLASPLRRAAMERRIAAAGDRPRMLPFLSALTVPVHAPLVVRTLGRFEIEHRGAPLRWSAKTPRRPLELLKLAVAAGGAVPVDRVLDALWPGGEADRAYRSLVSALHRLRRLTGEATLELRDGVLRLRDEDVWADALAFERATPDAVPLDLYGGDFLAGEDGDWVIAARERLRARHAECVQRIAAALVEAGRHRDALAVYTRAIGHDPLREAFYQGALGCCAAAGLRAEASALYERCRRTLGEALGLRPSARTEALYREIVAS